MKITTSLAMMCHAEQMESLRSQFRKHWKSTAEMYRKAGFSDRSLMHLEHLEWTNYRKQNENHELRPN
jgi:hypothetical protein